MKVLVRICLWFYVVVFVLTGGIMLFGAQDAAQVVGLTKDTLEGRAILEQSGVVSLFNQLRYMGALAIGFGATVGVLHRQILTEKRHATLFLVVLLLIPLSRTISLFLDGFPHFSLLLIMLGEYGLFALFALHTRRFVWGVGQGGTTVDPELAALAEATKLGSDAAPAARDKQTSRTP